MAFDHDGRLAAAAPWRGPKEEKVIRVWDLETDACRVLGPLESAGDGYEGNFGGLFFLPDGRLLASGADGLHIWDLENGSAKQLESRKFRYGVLSSVGPHMLNTFSQDLSSEQGWLLWTDVGSGQSRTLDSHGKKVITTAFDPTGKIAVSGDFDGVVRVGTVNGERPHLLYGHQGYINDLAVSPVGRRIASAAHDGTIRIWPMPDMKETPFHTLPYEEILERLRSVTNVRVVEDKESSTGYSIDYAPFPGWETVPKW